MSLYVRISDDEEPGCQDRHALNLTCSNWNYREKLNFFIGKWLFSNIIRLENSFTADPVLCVFGLKDQTGQTEGVRDRFGNYTTILNVTHQNGSWANSIPITVEIVEVNDPPRITSPTYILVTEKETGPRTWNITYSDPDNATVFPSTYTVTSLDIPEQLSIQERTRNVTGRVIQEFSLVLVKPFDADIFTSEETERFPPFRDDRFQTKRSIVDKVRYKRRASQLNTFKKNNIEQLSREQTSRYHSRAKRQNQESGPSINFTLEISDITGLWSAFPVTVHISDINDNEPVCTTPETVVIPREFTQGTLFDLRSICSDSDYSSQNKISDFRLSNMKGCIGGFRINGYGSLQDTGYLQRNMSVCEFEVIAMDREYATSVHLKLIFGECEPSLDARGVLWNASEPSRRNFMSCPEGYTGMVSRYCNSHATYEPAVYGCTSETISEISRKMDSLFDDSKSNISMTNTLYDLKNATSNHLMTGDVEAALNTLRRAADIVKYRTNDEANKTEAFLTVANNLLYEDNNDNWKSIKYKSARGAEELTLAIDKFVEGVVLSDENFMTKPQEYWKDNLMTSIGPLSSCSADLVFPNRSTVHVSEWIKNSDNKVLLQCSSAGKNKFFSSTFYKNISDLIPSRSFNKSLRNDTVNSAVISFSLLPEQPGKVDPPLEVTFDIINKSLKDPKCAYWKTESRGGLGSWATDGCMLKSYQNGIVVCLCDHLTNFAILMSPADQKEIPTEHTKTLSIISLVGCLISMVCLVVTIVVYIFYWKVLKSERSMILINLCVTLFIAYLVFLVGVNKTGSQVGCRVVAVLLHFIYLEVFLLMLTQGINLALTVLKPLKKQRYGWQMVLTSYGICLLIVAISMASTQLKGYGNAKFCWLSLESGLLWAFLAPVLFVIVANSVIIVIVLRAMFGTAAVKKKTDKEKLRTGIRSLLILLPVMGTTWVVGIFAVNRETLVFQYLFAIFNSVQGLLIFIFHCVLNAKIREAFKRTKASLFVSETVSTASERLPMKSADTSDTLVK